MKTRQLAFGSSIVACLWCCGLGWSADAQRSERQRPGKRAPDPGNVKYGPLTPP